VVSSADKIKLLHNKKPVPGSKQVVADIVGPDTKELELGVMVIGGAPDPKPQESSAETTAIKAREPEAAGPGSENARVEAETGVNPGEEAREAHFKAGTNTTGGGTDGTQSSSAKQATKSVQQGEESGDAVLQSAEFWTDLEGFLAQRIRSQEDAKRLRGTFERAWRSGSAVP